MKYIVQLKNGSSHEVEADKAIVVDKGVRFTRGDNVVAAYPEVVAWWEEGASRERSIFEE